MSEMTAAISPSFNANAKQNKPPSLPSESPYRRPKSRVVASRYLNDSSSLEKRCPSPTVARSVTPSNTTTRPKSTPRRESLYRRGSSGGEVCSEQRMLSTSGRSLITSFQVTEKEYRSKLNSSPSTTPGRETIERKKMTSTATVSRSGGAQQEKSKLSDQWPRSLQPSSLSRSVDLTDTRKKLTGFGNGVARHSQSTSNQLQHRLEPGSPVTKCNEQRKISVDIPVKSLKGSKLLKSEQIRPASPGKFAMIAALSSPRGTSIARGISPSRVVVPPRGISPARTSPLRARNSLSKNTPLVLNFAVDAKEKVRESGVADVHLLKILHNRLLQWRFSNARTNAVICTQKMRAEKRLYNAWINISKLYDCVRAKRIELQYLKQNLKLRNILNRQMGHLEEWLVMDQNHMGSLVGAAEALKGSTLCLPVDCATVNVQSVNGAICSAVDVMQAMASSLCLLLPKVKKISSLTAELAHVNIKEKGRLDVCRDLLNTISALQVTECSLRTQVTQLK